MSTQAKMIYILSDSIGETAEKVARAAARQFQESDIVWKRIGNIHDTDEIRSIMEEVPKHGFVAYTFVQPELREMIKQESIRLGVRAVDIMGPMMQAFIDTFHDAPKRQPGLLHELDEDYFRRVDAIEFAVKSDDGRDVRALLQAHIVLIGVSRTSKTPLSIYLAHKCLKVANLPLIPEVKPPKQLFDIPSHRVIGLTMDVDKLLKIRTERLRAVGLPNGAQYATSDRIRQELAYSEQLMERIGCPVINVSDRAIEETAGMIMGYL